MLGEQCRFLAQFVRKPGAVGAVAPSSARLAEKMVEWIEWERAEAVVEFGPGTGAFTGHILSRLKPGARFFAVEINPIFVSALRDRYPGVTVHEENVCRVGELCRHEGIEQVDAVICGLPWAAFCHQDQVACLESLKAVLSPNGQFATFAYLQGLLLPAGQRFRARLREYFSRVESSNVAWRNLPPAFVYRCRR